MAQPKSKRSRKRRNPSAAPRAVPSQRRVERADKLAVAARDERRERKRRTGLDARGERPPSPFGGLPVSEIAIFAGAVAFVVGFISGGGPAVIVGIVLCALGVLEVTAREHFSGYRSHALLLAAIPAIGVMFLVGAIVGTGPKHRGVLVGAAVPVFALLVWQLRNRYQAAHHRRTARPPRA
jgi:hypothetical protein